MKAKRVIAFALAAAFVLGAAATPALAAAASAPQRAA